MQQKKTLTELNGLPNILEEKDWKLFLADVLENSPQPFASVYHNGRINYCNSAFCNLLGYAQEEIEQMTWMDFTPPEWCDFVVNVIRKKFHETEKPQRYQKEYLCKDGSRLPVELLVHRVTDSNGNFIYHNAFVTDISERKKLENEIKHYQENLEKLVKERTAKMQDTITQLTNECEHRGLIERALRAANQRLVLSEERFSLIFNFSPLSISISALDSGKMINCNERFLEKTGYQIDEIIGKTSIDLKLWVNTKDRDRVIETIKEYGSVHNFEARYRTRTGEIRDMLYSGAVINMDDKPHLLSITTDITERKKFEKEMMRLEKLNLIGQMASGIGHEVRNPMTTIKGFLQLLSNEESDSRKQGYYELMIDELDRANSILTEFLSLAKDKMVELSLTCINTILDALYPLLSVDALKQDKRIMLNKGEIPNIRVNGKEIRQLILNLVKNGLDAMPKQGVLTIGTYTENNEVILYVEDRGAGIDSEILDKLGTPFVTTKDEGTGLGLAVCYSIAERHNAKMDFKTGSTGTTFYVRFEIPQTQIAEQAS